MAEAEDIFEQTLGALRTQLRNLRRLRDALTRRQEARSLLETMRNARQHNPDLDRSIDNDPDRSSQWGEIEREIQQLREENDRLQQENADRQRDIDTQQADLDRQQDTNLDRDRDRVPDDVENRHEASDDARLRDEQAEDRDRTIDQDGDGVDDAVEDRERDEAERGREAEARQEQERQRDREEQDRGPDPTTPVAAAAGTAAAVDELNDERGDELNGPEAETEQDAELGDDGVIRPAGEQAQQAELNEPQGEQFVDADGATQPVIGEDQQPQGPGVDQPAERVPDGQQSQADGQQAQPEGQQAQADGQQVQADGQQVQADGQRQQPVERVLDEQRAERAQSQDGQQQGARPNGMTPDEIGRNQHVANAGTSPATGAAVPPREDALTGGRGGQTPAQQHQQSINRGGRGGRGDGPGLGD